MTAPELETSARLESDYLIGGHTNANYCSTENDNGAYYPRFTLLGPYYDRRRVAVFDALPLKVPAQRGNR